MAIFFSDHKSIDFYDILFDDDVILEPSKIIIVLIRKSEKGGIVHSHPAIDRCCKWSGWGVDVQKLQFDGRDETKRISCNISESAFLHEYVLKRKFVMLNNCTDDWKAKKWTLRSKQIMMQCVMAILCCYNITEKSLHIVFHFYYRVYNWQVCLVDILPK